MCDGRIHRTQRFPANPANGQVPVWNALTKKWEAQNQSGGGSLPSGSNPNDMLYWDATNEEWIVGAEVSGFNPSSDYSISGQFDYSNGLILSATDPSSAFSPITGVSIFADTSNNFSVKRADGIRYSFSSAFLSTDRKFAFPDRDGKFAMSDFDNEFTATQTFTQINNGRAGFPGKINWYNDSGSLVAASGIVPGASNYFQEGANFNFRSNAIGFFFGSGSSFINPTARMHVRGDGTNPIARFESSTGTYFASISQFAFGTIFSMNGFSITENTSSLNFSSTSTGTSAIGTLPIYDFIANSDLSTASTSNFFRVNRAITPSAGSANFRPFTVRYTINATGAQTGNLTGILLDANETALNGMTHNLMDLQVGGNSKFRVQANGPAFNINAFELVFGSTIRGTDFQIGANGCRLVNFNDGSFRITNNAGTSFNLLQFGGSTNAFPALKRSGNVIEVKLADDSSYAPLYALTLLSMGTMAIGGGIVNFLGSSDGVLRLTNSGINDFNRLQFGGTTNLFPAIKRNAAGLDFRLADDSGWADITARSVGSVTGIIYLNTSANVFIIRGTGSPEGAQAASVGSIYLRTDGGDKTTLYVKESGTGNTGWIAK